MAVKCVCCGLFSLWAFCESSDKSHLSVNNFQWLNCLMLQCKLWQKPNVKLLGWTLDLSVSCRLAFPCQLVHKQNCNPEWVTATLSPSFFILRRTSWTRCWGPPVQLLSGRVVSLESCMLKIKIEVSINIFAGVVSSVFYHKSSSLVSKVIWRENSFTI